MNKKSTFKFICAGLISTMVAGNAVAQSVSYKKILDDPYDTKNLFISLQPFFAEAFTGGNFATLGYGIQANYGLGKIANFEFSFQSSYLDINARKNRTVTGTTSMLGMHKVIEAGGYFHLIDRSKSKNVKVVLSSTTSGNYTYTKYIMVPGTVRAVTGVHGGIFYYNYAITSEDKDPSFIGRNTTTNAIDTLNGAKAYDLTAGKDVYLFTNMNVSGIYGGFMFSRTTNLKINTDNYGICGTRMMSEFYIDGMFAPVIAYEDMVIASKGGATYDLSETPKKHLGWRLGYQVIIPRTVGMQFKTEIGQKPGWGATSNFYLNFNWGITIGAKVKVPTKTVNTEAPTAPPTN